MSATNDRYEELEEMDRVELNVNNNSGRREELADDLEASPNDNNIDIPESSEKKEETKLPTINASQLKWLLFSGLKEFWLITIGTVFLLISSGLGLVLPSFVGSMIDSVSKAEDSKEYLNRVTLILFGVVCGIGITSAIRNYCFTYAGEKVVARLRKDLFNAIIVQDVSFFDTTKTGELINRLSSDTKSLENAVTVNLSMFLRNFIQMIGGIGLLFFISWKLTLVMLSVIPPVIIIALFYGKYVKKLAKEVQDALANSSDVAEEAISNVRTVRSFSKEERHQLSYGSSIDKTLQLGRKSAIANGLFIGGATFGGNACIILVLWYGGTLLINKEVSIGDLTSFIIYTVFVATSFGTISSLFFDIVKAIGATARVHALLEKIPEIERKDINNCPSHLRELLSLEGHIKFNNISFSYPTRKDSLVLKDFNLDLQPSSIVALVGKSGQGKSTVTNLIQRFYDPNEGEITLDGVPLTEIDPVWLRKNIGLVSQEPVLFATSIRENICYGWTDIVPPTEEQIIDAATKANAHEFISSFSQGYDTQVGERGVRLSGGQKQRIAIARAILKNPKILLFDEATSSLDSLNEHLVQEALNRLMMGRTVLIIAHRLSTVKGANIVCVIEGGQVVESGTHDELIQKGGKYKILVERQMLNHNVE